MLRVSLRSLPPVLPRARRMPTACAAAEALPEVVCVHCSARFPSERLEYGVRADQLGATMAAAFTQLSRDEEATQFLRRCADRSRAGRWAQSTAAAALRSALSLTDANALVGRGSMHVLSTAQARALLRLPEGAPPAASLLDVGAGDGSVTAMLAPLFRQVVATEVSLPMVRRLQSRDFAAVLHAADVGGVREAAAAAGVQLEEGGFSVIALMNVLDRCDEPLTLLTSLRSLLAPGTGRLLLAVVLPFRPFVEVGAARRPPLQDLCLPENVGFERSLSLLWDNVLAPAGFELEAVSRVPYLSDGDMRAPVYCLDDAILVLRAV